MSYAQRRHPDKTMRLLVRIATLGYALPGTVLAVKIYELTSKGEWERAALPAVALVVGGLLPVIILTRKTEA